MTDTHRTASRTATSVAPVMPHTAIATPSSLTDGRFDAAGFWGRWQKINGDVMIEHARGWMERLGWVDNFRAAAAGTLPEFRRGREFTDSDVYKLVEAMSWELGRNPTDTALRQRRDELVGVIAAAQDPDGYLNTKFGRPGQEPRYSNLEWGHELYNYGHLLQAAIAAVRVDGSSPLLDVAHRVADHIIEIFGEGANQGYCGHPNIETALAEFGRLTGARRYIEQASLFVARRGAGRLDGGAMGREYFQDLMPVRQTVALHGHAVRALYLAAGAVDVAVECDDRELLRSLEQQWEHTVQRRTHVTGGMGSRHTGEAFGDDWELSPDRAYCETCAGVGSIMFSWRLYLATGRMRYIDLIERTLFNVVATSPATDGKSFFYSNPLQQRTEGEVPEPDEPSRRAATSQRAPWFEVSCCPPNVARTLSTLATYAVTSTESGVQVLQFGSGTWTVDTNAGPVTITVETDYPSSGDVVVQIIDAPASGTTLTVRIPAWSATTRIHAGDLIEFEQNGESVTFTGLTSGDQVSISLDMTPRFVYPARQVDALRGSVAVERGPQVFALEGVDLPDGTDIADVTIHTDFAITSIGPDVLQLSGRIRRDAGTGTGTGAGTGTATGAGTGTGWPYSAVPLDDAGLPAHITLRPYQSWGERGPSTMRIWLPID